LFQKNGILKFELGYLQIFSQNLHLLVDYIIFTFLQGLFLQSPILFPASNYFCCFQFWKYSLFFGYQIAAFRLCQLFFFTSFFQQKTKFKTLNSSFKFVAFFVFFFSFNVVFQFLFQLLCELLLLPSHLIYLNVQRTEMYYFN
jgi:hypothetical protein